MKNRLILSAVPFFHQEKSPPNRILVVSTTALGDSLWATPSIESLRKTFPSAYIAVLTSPIGAQVLKHNPWTDAVHVLKEPMLLNFFSMRKELGTFSDIAILHASQRLILPLCATLGATRIAGTIGINKGLDSLLTVPLNNNHEHAIIRRLQVAEAIGAKRHSVQLSLFLQPDELPPPNLPEKFILLHPGSQDPFRRWPASHYIQVGKELQTLGYSILVSGTARESELVRAIASAIPGAQISDPKLPLRRFAALLNKAELLITNDTGPVHIASALKRPLIALYTPSDPKLYGPLEVDQAIAISKPRTCGPCLQRKCREPFCFLQISPQEVITAAKKLLKLP
jgi:ADP-heptose:LPS heptosyltransferase